MKKNMRIALLHAAREVDAVWEPPRGFMNLALLWMASKLKSQGHEVFCLDEGFRADGWKRRELFLRKLLPGEREAVDVPLECTWDQFQENKMADFNRLDAHEFVRRHTAFKDDGSVERIVARIGNSEQGTIDHLRSLDVDVVGITITASGNYASATSLGREIKRQLPHVRILVGGRHVSADVEKFVCDNPWADSVASGDAIHTIERMSTGVMLNKVVEGGYRDIDEFPLLDCSFLEDAGYPGCPTYHPSFGNKPIDWMMSRGCMRDCDCCVTKGRGRGVSHLKWDVIRAQLDHFVAHGYTEVVFEDDALLFQADKYFIPLLDELKARGLSFSDHGGLEFESFTSEVAKAIERYNRDPRPGRCVSLYIPFNSREWNRNTTAVGSMVKRYHAHLDNIRRVRAAGVYVFTSYIVGTPDQTHESFREDLEQLRILLDPQDPCVDLVLPLCATMLPGSHWHERNGHNIVNPYDWVGYNLFSTHHKTPYMSPRQIEECMVSVVKGLEGLQDIKPWCSAFPRV